MSRRNASASPRSWARRRCRPCWCRFRGAGRRRPSCSCRVPRSPDARASGAPVIGRERASEPLWTSRGVAAPHTGSERPPPIDENRGIEAVGWSDGGAVLLSRDTAFVATLSATPPAKAGIRGPEHVQHAPAVSRERSDEAVAFSTTPGPFRARRLRSGLATDGPETHAGARGPTPRGRRARAVTAAALRAERLSSQSQGRPSWAKLDNVWTQPGPILSTCWPGVELKCGHCPRFRMRRGQAKSCDVCAPGGPPAVTPRPRGSHGRR